MPIINADLWVLRQGLCIFIRSQNLWDFALDKKRKNKTKSFCLARSWKSVGFLRRTNHSRDVSNNFENENLHPDFTICFGTNIMRTKLL